jgi:DNA repair protein RadC
VTDVDTARRLLGWLACAEKEAAEALYLDPEWRLCGRHRFEGSRGAVLVPIRALVAKGLAADARYVVLGHNHPSGDAEPSARDLAFTRRLVDLLWLIEMPLADHLVVSRDRTTSMRERGLL